MSGYIEYEGMPCECIECGAKVSEGNARVHVRWHNQYGAGIRIFCHDCGVWTDYNNTLRKGLKINAFRPIIPHPEYADRVTERAWA